MGFDEARGCFSRDLAFTDAQIATAPDEMRRLHRPLAQLTLIKYGTSVCAPY
jgi:hypothetical protein